MLEKFVVEPIISNAERFSKEVFNSLAPFAGSLLAGSILLWITWAAYNALVEGEFAWRNIVKKILIFTLIGSMLTVNNKIFYGYIYDYFMNKTEPPIPDPIAFVPSPTEKQIQITISQYIINSVFYALIDADVLSYVLINIPGTNYTVTTDYIDYFLPGLVDQYGSNQMVIFLCSLPIAPEIDFLHPLYDITLEVNATCEIQPIHESRPIMVGKLTLNLNVSLDVLITNGSLSVNFTSATCQNLDIIDTNFTTQHLDYLQDTINLGLALGMKAIEPTIAIPGIEGISFNDTEILFGDGFIRIETNPDMSNWTMPNVDTFEKFYDGFTWVNFLDEDMFRTFLNNNTSYAY